MAPERHFSADYVERAVLRDGTPVRLRRVVPEDKALLLAGFRRMSAESRYARFLAPKDTLSEDELRYLTEIDHEHHFAIGAIALDGDEGAPRGVGVARFIRLPDPPGTAEAAIAVLDDMHGRGLGKLLFLRLCAAAAERGIAHFRCEVLGSNTGMRALIEDISPDPRIESSGGVMSIEMALPDVHPAEPPAGPAPHGPAYRLFRAAAEGAVEWTAAVRRLWRRE
jgi:GNAT superfamily N-acetyltransferase